MACFESHRKAWARIVEEDWRQAIVMEDDAEVDLSEHMPRVAQFVADAPPDWQLLYLGINNANVNLIDPTHTCCLAPCGGLSKCVRPAFEAAYDHATCRCAL